MAASILSQDIIAICLLFAGGDINLSLTEVIRRVEEYQEIKNRHFGISIHDFRGLFYNLLNCKLGIKSVSNEINEIKLSDTIIDIIEYHDAYFNDEGEYWFKRNQTYSEDIDSYISHIDKEHKIAIKQQMKIFFKYDQIKTFSPESVKKFMEEINIIDAILYQCSRSGESS
ncbi:MAG: hypothetical protein ABIK92_06695 [Pseudomonadota bacterium]